ncbi:MAG: prohibitin family protein [Chloroflexi bacterium]|nr:prohibitin family protein [Chloroflexota bacterium]
MARNSLRAGGDAAGAAGRGLLGRFGCGGLGIAAAVVVVLGYLAMSVNVVPPGHVGVVVQLGQVQPNPLPPGVYFRPFFVQNVIDFETRVRPHNFREIDAASREYQSVKLTGTLNFSIDAPQADDLYQRVGLDFAGRVIDAAFSDTIKEIIPRFAVTEILAKREEIRTQTKDKLSQTLGRYGILVEDVYLTNISFSPEYTQAIEQKQVAQQLVEREREVLNQKKIQAEQSEVQALGEAKAEVARAQGAAEANRLLTQSITPELIEYQRVQKWDGRMPLYQGNANVMLPVPSPTPR